MTANRSQYMILDTERQGRQNLTYSCRPALPPIRTSFSPDNRTLEEIAQEQHPHDMTREIRQHVQQMRQHLQSESHRVTFRSERHEMIFDPIEASTAPHQATPPVAALPSPPPATTET